MRGELEVGAAGWPLWQWYNRILGRVLLLEPTYKSCRGWAPNSLMRASVSSCFSSRLTWRAFGSGMLSASGVRRSFLEFAQDLLDALQPVLVVRGLSSSERSRSRVKGGAVDALVAGHAAVERVTPLKL